MSASIQGFRSRAKAQAEELVEAISAAEGVIITTIERECEALRGGRMLAAKALHTRLCDAARLYLDATRAARASLWTMDQVLPGTRSRLEDRRSEFSALLKIELAVLAAERAVAGEAPMRLEFSDAPETALAARARPTRSGGRTVQPLAPLTRQHQSRR